MNKLIRVGLFFITTLYGNLVLAQEYTIGIIPQRSAQLIAQYWNPILEYVSKKSGVTLVMRTTRTGVEARDRLTEGEYDFIYNNHNFQPKTMKAGYQVILRPNAPDVATQIVVLQDSPVQSVEQLNGQTVGFVSKAAYAGYWVPMDHLLREKVSVTPNFGGNQEGVMAQLKAGRVAAVGVSRSSMAIYAQRENLAYRVIWTSANFHETPISAHPRVSPAVVEAIRNAFDGMPNDPEGIAVLEASAKVINKKAPLGFKKASQADYQDMIDFYTTTLVKEND
jgi:phosphonate transport system substrate-binding protein